MLEAEIIFNERGSKVIQIFYDNFSFIKKIS